MQREDSLPVNFSDLRNSVSGVSIIKNQKRKKKKEQKRKRKKKQRRNFQHTYEVNLLSANPVPTDITRALLSNTFQFSL